MGLSDEEKNETVKGLKMGADYYISKPFDGDELEEKCST